MLFISTAVTQRLESDLGIERKGEKMKYDIVRKSRKIVIIFVMLLFAAGTICHGRMIMERKNDRFVFFEKMPVVTAGIIQSGSMSPVLEKGDLVFVTQQKTYQTGDIVLVYDEKERPVLHRLVIYNTLTDKILTKGDANDSFDEHLSCNAIQGKLFFFIPKAGIVLSILKSTGVRLFLLSAALFLTTTGIFLFADKKQKMARPSIKGEDIVQKSGFLTRGRCVLTGIMLLLIALLLFLPKLPRIGACFRADLLAEFSMQAAPSEETDADFGVDEIEIWMD